MPDKSTAANADTGSAGSVFILVGGSQQKIGDWGDGAPAVQCQFGGIAFFADGQAGGCAAGLQQFIVAIGINAMDFPAVGLVIVDGTNGDAAATFDGFRAGVVDG